MTAPAVAGLALLLTGLSPARADDGLGRPEIIPPYVYPEILARWWQWSLAFPADADPASDTAPQESGQSGRIWFLAGVHGSAQTGVISIVARHITIPAGKFLFFPVLSTWSDNSGCPTYTDFTVPQLEALNAGAWSAVARTTCTIDGVPVAGLGSPQTTRFLVDSTVFGYTLAGHDNILAADYGEPCIPDGTTVFPAVAQGVCLMLAPLSPGQHTIHTVGIVGPAASPFVEIDLTYNISVVRDSDQEGNE